MLVSPKAAPVAPSALASCCFDIPATVVAMAHPLRAGPDGSAHRLPGVNQQRRPLAAAAGGYRRAMAADPGADSHPPPDVALAHRPTIWGVVRSRTGGPPHPMDVGQFADAVVQWLDGSGLDRVVLVGRSSGTQVAARVAVRRPRHVRALVLASPTMDPRFRSTRRILLAWRRNHPLELPSLDAQHTSERQRAGWRRVRHALKVHLADSLEDVVPQVPVPVLVLHGDQDRLCTDEWARELTGLAPEGRLDRKSTRLNSSHANISYAVFCLKKKKTEKAKAHNITKNNERMSTTTLY